MLWGSFAELCFELDAVMYWRCVNDEKLTSVRHENLYDMLD